MPQAIPYHFDPPASGTDDDGNLVIKELPKGRQITWPLIGATVFIPDDGVDSLGAAAASNGGRFSVHGNVGFSVDSYHEFFLGALPTSAAGFRMGDVEATFGDATPLAAYLFEPRRSKWNGTWDDISSVRIFGADHGDAELAFLNASARYFEQTGYWLDLASIGEPWLEEPEERDLSAIVAGPPMNTYLEPLRFLAAGAQQGDDIAACVYFYRVIEFFSFFVNARDISKLRHDASIADAQFARKMLDLVARDERGPILRLVQTLVDTPMLEAAKRDQLVDTAKEVAYAEKVYEFRNSIVHGKFSHGFSLASPSPFSGETSAAKWRPHLLTLARRAMNGHR